MIERSSTVESMYSLADSQLLWMQKALAPYHSSSLAILAKLLSISGGIDKNQERQLKSLNW
jgi:hypothetical protein